MTKIAEMIVRNSKEKVPLGTLLLVDELILPQDLDFALDHQKHSNQLIGQILITIGALDNEALEETLKLQNNSTLSH